ncbi:MAG TPA: glutamine--fructose-6-phosphate transaminase (isomerizing) [Bacilli bacterium]|nr:glutamine--fructose-6-phosphate transaminase (isomerizing) [Bacilli bacterium]HPS18612.1 glutamine--fructose-6-phosphate transaminase (isomerizing) [Bacilli bacterium]
MCGIVGCIGNIDTRKYLLEGLKSLDYRGYDSAGIAYVLDKSIRLTRTVGSVERLMGKVPDFSKADMGIGHTRWATHGVPCLKNCHPIQSMDGHITLIHNGVIENFLEVKSELIKQGYKFHSDTDSEVIASYIERCLSTGHDMLMSMKLAMKKLQGSFALAIIYDKDLTNLYFMKRSSPLMIGVGKDFNLIASDAVPMIKYTNKVVDVSDNQMGVLSATDVKLFDSDLNPVSIKYSHKNPELLSTDLHGYPHYMLKEIEEIEMVVRRLMMLYYQDGSFILPKGLLREIKRSDFIVFIGCGTSYHASLVGSRFFHSIGKDSAVFIASEWAYYPIIPGKKPFVIMLSQSGETADMIHCMNIVQEHGLKSLIITNTKGSTLERAADYSMLLEAGLEVSVASTKAYVAMVTALVFLTNAYTNRHKIIGDLSDCSRIIGEIKQTLKPQIQELAKKLKGSHDIYFLGRGFDYDFALEASLKLKEISYIHSEAIAGGELKHGPIALIEKGTPVIVFITDEVTEASMRNNIQEVKARGADVYVVSTKKLSKEGDFIVVGDYKRYLSSVAISSIAFYFAYYVSTAKGINVDKPRNLAKSVTVE